MASTTLAQATPGGRGPDALLAIQGLSIARPLVLPDSLAAHSSSITLTGVLDTATGACEVRSCTATATGSTGAWTSHARGSAASVGVHHEGQTSAFASEQGRQGLQEGDESNAGLLYDRKRLSRLAAVLGITQLVSEQMRTKTAAATRAALQQGQPAGSAGQNVSGPCACICEPPPDTCPDAASYLAHPSQLDAVFQLGALGYPSASQAPGSSGYNQAPAKIPVAVGLYTAGSSSGSAHDGQLAGPSWQGSTPGAAPPAGGPSATLELWAGAQQGALPGAHRQGSRSSTDFRLLPSVSAGLPSSVMGLGTVDVKVDESWVQRQRAAAAELARGQGSKGHTKVAGTATASSIAGAGTQGHASSAKSDQQQGASEAMYQVEWMVGDLEQQATDAAAAGTPSASQRVPAASAAISLHVLPKHKAGAELHQNHGQGKDVVPSSHALAVHAGQGRHLTSSAAVLVALQTLQADAVRGLLARSSQLPSSHMTSPASTSSLSAAMTAAAAAWGVVRSAESELRGTLPVTLEYSAAPPPHQYGRGSTAVASIVPRLVPALAGAHPPCLTYQVSVFGQGAIRFCLCASPSTAVQPCFLLKWQSPAFVVG
jgi:hypothetical protein